MYIVIVEICMQIHLYLCSILLEHQCMKNQYQHPTADFVSQIPLSVQHFYSHHGWSTGGSPVPPLRNKGEPKAGLMKENQWFSEILS